MLERDLSIQHRSDPQGEDSRSAIAPKSSVKKVKLCEIDVRQYEQVIEALYDIPLAETSWMECLTQLRRILNADHVFLGYGAEPKMAAPIYTGKGDPARIVQALQQSGFSGLPVNEVHSIDGILGDSKRQGSPCSEYPKLLNIRHILGIDLSNESGIRYPLRIMRSESGGAFSVYEKKFCRSLIPHLQRTLRLLSRQEHIKSKRQLCADILSHAGLGVISLSMEGFISEIDVQAQRILDDSDGISVSPDGRHFRFYDQAKEVEVVHAVKMAIAKSAEGVASCCIDVFALKQRAQTGYINISVSSVTPMRANRAAVVFIRATYCRSNESQEEMARQMFHLTPKQAKLAMLLMDGYSLTESSKIQRNTRNTMRLRRDALLMKTSLNRANQFMKLILRNLFLA